MNRKIELSPSLEELLKSADRVWETQKETRKRKPETIRVRIDHRFSAGTIFKVIVVSATASVFAKVTSEFLMEPMKEVKLRLEKRDPRLWKKVTGEHADDQKTAAGDSDRVRGSDNPSAARRDHRSRNREASGPAHGGKEGEERGDSSGNGL
jgi:hypothetical protein